MRHKKRGNHLSRTASHKKALMRNMAAQVIEHKEIKTTTAKAKELRGYVERLITYAKKGTLHHRRLAFKLLQNKGAVHHLFEEVGPAFEGRNGGYTRIIKLGNRKGDAAPISIFQLVGYEKAASAEPAQEKKKKGKKDKAPKKEAAPAQEEVAAPEEKPEEEVPETEAKEADGTGKPEDKE